MLANQEARSITILGIDPGLRHTGYGVINKIDNQLIPIAYGVIKSGEGPLAKRLGKIFSEVRAIVHQYQPDYCAIEVVFVNINPKSSLALGQARGAAICALTESNKSITEITALQIKQSVVGYGRATKNQIKKMVTNILKLDKETLKSRTITYDEADALACAISCSLLIPKTNAKQLNNSDQSIDSLKLFKQQRRRRISQRWKTANI